MIVVGIETATIEVGVGLARDGVVISAMTTRSGRRHVETLHPALEAICSASGIALCDIDAVGVDIGPGLFTGLRVGIAAAKALAFALSVPIVGVRSTEVLIAAADSSLPVIPIIDMRRGDVAFQLARSNDGDHLRGFDLHNELHMHDEVVEIGTPESLGERFVGLAGDYLLVGDGARRYFDRIVPSASTRFRLATHQHDAPSVAALATLASDRFAGGEYTDAVHLEPVYLRQADAKSNFVTRQDEELARAASLSTTTTEQV